jgi:hypothetical protein
MTMPGQGKVATSFIDAMRGMPLVLALCVMNLSLIGFAYYQASSFNSQRKSNVQLVVTMQTEVQKLLSQCIVPPPPTARPQ